MSDTDYSSWTPAARERAMRERAERHKREYKQLLDGGRERLKRVQKRTSTPSCIAVGVKYRIKQFPSSNLPDHWAQEMAKHIGDIVTVSFIEYDEEDRMSGIRMEENTWYWETTDLEEMRDDLDFGINNLFEI